MQEIYFCLPGSRRVSESSTFWSWTQGSLKGRQLVGVLLFVVALEVVVGGVWIADHFVAPLNLAFQLPILFVSTIEKSNVFQNLRLRLHDVLTSGSRLALLLAEWLCLFLTHGAGRAACRRCRWRRQKSVHVVEFITVLLGFLFSVLYSQFTHTRRSRKQRKNANCVANSYPNCSASLEN